MKIENQKIIGGVQFEAVRCKAWHGATYWRAKVSQTGYIFESGVFKSESRPALWASMEDTARRRGDTWKAESLTAHLPYAEQREAIRQLQAAA